jgi:hypothetical protein
MDKDHERAAWWIHDFAMCTTWNNGERPKVVLNSLIALLATVRAEGEPHREPRFTLGTGQMIDPCHCVACQVAQTRDETVARYHALLQNIDAWVDLDVPEHPGLREAVVKALDECPPACTSPECEAAGYVRGEEAGKAAERREVVAFLAGRGSPNAERIEREAHHAKS